MEIISLRDHTRLFALEDTVTALGFFDGMHLGHQALIDYAVERATALGCKSAVLTFDDDMTLKPGANRLTDGDTRLSLIGDRGVDYVILARFGDVRDMTPMTFVKNVLVGLCHTKEAVCGFNYRFGQGRSGDATMLTQYLKLFGASTHVMPPTMAENGQVISSSLIREAIKNGDMEAATAYMGAPFALVSSVLHGRAIGRTIGAPTINQVFPPFMVVPKRGVYATTCYVGEKPYIAVTNVGVRPTVGGENVTCESHLIGFSGSLYGETVTLLFNAFLREETHFASLDELQTQIMKDIRKVETLYGIH